MSDAAFITRLIEVGLVQTAYVCVATIFKIHKACAAPQYRTASVGLVGPPSLLILEALQATACVLSHRFWLVLCSLLLQCDKDNISEKVRRELRCIISDPAFTPDQVRTRQCQF